MLVAFLAASSCDRGSSGPRLFRATADDGSEATLLLEFKPRGCIEENSTVGCYYYLAQLYPKGDFDAVTDGVGAPSNREHCGYATRVHFAFYDANGFSLYSLRGNNTFAPGWSNNEDELKEIESGWEWKGRFAEAELPRSSFREITSVTVRFGRSECHGFPVPE